MSIDFLRLKSYTNSESSGEVKIIGSDDLSSLQGKVGVPLMLFFLCSLLVKRTSKSDGYTPDCESTSKYY